MSTESRQTSFAGGELGPQLLGRFDQVKYTAGMQTCRNFMVTRTGMLENRPGTIYRGPPKSAAIVPKMVRFGVSATQGMMLEFGNLYMRPWKNGANINVSGSAAWSSVTAYTIGQSVTQGGIAYVALQASTNITPNANPTFWYPLTNGIYEIPTPIATSALPVFQFTQVNDLMYLASQQFYPQVLSHFGDSQWGIANFVASPGLNAPASVVVTVGNPPGSTLAAPSSATATGGGAPGPNSQYLVTAYNATVQGIPATCTAFGGSASVAFPVTVSWNAVAGALGYSIYKLATAYGIVGITKSSALSFVDNGITSATAVVTNQFLSVGYSAFTYAVTAIGANGIESYATAAAQVTGNNPTPANPNVVSYTAVTGATSYNIYLLTNGVYGFIGSSSTTSFNDTFITPNTSKQPPVNSYLLATPNDYPAVVSCYQQRLLFANSINQPQTVFASAIGVFTNFAATLPVLDSGSLNFTIAGRQRQYVQAMVDLGKLVIHTSAGEYVAYGNAFNTITPTAINLVQNGYSGSTLSLPVTIGTTGIFIQARGTILRNIEYTIYTQTYAGNDLTEFSPHLFEGSTIVQADWQQIYNSILWVVTSTGRLLGMTYNKSQSMIAWHRHDTQGGFFEQVCVVPEGTNDVVYVVVRRTVNGATVRYIESFAAREFQDTVALSDAIFTDASLTYDGRATNAANAWAGTTLTASGGTNWTPQEVITLTVNAAASVPSLQVGNTFVLQQLDPITSLITDFCNFTILSNGVSGGGVQTFTAAPTRQVPTWARSTAIATWGVAVHTFSAPHLASLAISGQGDGAVALNALTDGVPTVVGSTGAFTTALNYLVLTVGLPITAQMQAMPWIDASGKSKITDNQRIIECAAVFYNSRSGQFGQDFQHMSTWKQRGLQNENMGSPPALFSGQTLIPISGTWRNFVAIAFQQLDPLPFALSAIVLAGNGED